jgi:hypothetical protein
MASRDVLLQRCRSDGRLQRIVIPWARPERRYVGRALVFVGLFLALLWALPLTLDYLGTGSTLTAKDWAVVLGSTLPFFALAWLVLRRRAAAGTTVDLERRVVERGGQAFPLGQVAAVGFARALKESHVADSSIATLVPYWRVLWIRCGGEATALLQTGSVTNATVDLFERVPSDLLFECLVPATAWRAARALVQALQVPLLMVEDPETMDLVEPRELVLPVGKRRHVSREKDPGAMTASDFCAAETTSTLCLDWTKRSFFTAMPRRVRRLLVDGTSVHLEGRGLLSKKGKVSRADLEALLLRGGSHPGLLLMGPDRELLVPTDSEDEARRVRTRLVRFLERER